MPSIIQNIVQLLSFFFSIDEKYLDHVESAIMALLISIMYLIVEALVILLERLFKAIFCKLQLKIEYFNEKNKSISDLKFKKIDAVNFESKLLKINFGFKSSEIPLKIIKKLGGKLRLSFNPNLINCELENGFLDGNSKEDLYYREETYIYINLFSIYEPSKGSVGNVLNLMVLPLQQSTAEVKIDIVSEINEGWLKFIPCFLCKFLLKCYIRIEHQNIILKSY